MGVIHAKWWSEALELGEITKGESIERRRRAKPERTLAIKVNREAEEPLKEDEKE